MQLPTVLDGAFERTGRKPLLVLAAPSDFCSGLCVTLLTLVHAFVPKLVTLTEASRIGGSCEGRTDDPLAIGGLGRTPVSILVAYAIRCSLLLPSLLASEMALVTISVSFSLALRNGVREFANFRANDRPTNDLSERFPLARGMACPLLVSPHSETLAAAVCACVAQETTVTLATAMLRLGHYGTLSCAARGDTTPLPVRLAFAATRALKHMTFLACEGAHLAIGGTSALHAALVGIFEQRTRHWKTIRE